MKELTDKILAKKGFIFDVDGTLVDSMGMWNAVDQLVVKNGCGRDVSKEEIKAFRDSILYGNANYAGNLYHLYFEEAIKKYGLNMTLDEFRDMRRDSATELSTNELDFKPGAGDFLLLLKELGKKIGVATTTIRNQIEIYSNKNKKMSTKASISELADAIVTFEDVSNKKPDPEVYLKAIEQLGLEPSECIAFEDSLNGVISAKNAGLEVVCVFDESALSEHEMIYKICDYKIKSFDELIKTIELSNPSME